MYFYYLFYLLCNKYLLGSKSTNCDQPHVCSIKITKILLAGLSNKMKKKLQAEEGECKKVLDNLQKEADHWKYFWNIDATVQMVGGWPALIMPYLWMCNKEELAASQEFRKAAVNAIKSMASKGYKHDDLSPRHVGFYKNAHEHLVAVLIDLSFVSPVPQDDQNAIEEMMKNLHM